MPKYCIDNSSLKVSNFYKDTLNDEILLNIPQNSSSFKIPSIKIIDYFQNKGFEAADLTQGIITLDRSCSQKNKFTFLTEHLKKIYKQTYENITIDSINISPQKPLPQHFDQFTFKKAIISKSKLKKGEGTFIVYYNDEKNIQKILYFTFQTQAFLPLFQASQDISNGSILNSSNAKPTLVQIQNAPTKPLQNPNNLIAKFNIKKGTILSTRQFKKNTLIKKGSFIKAILKEGKLVIGIDVKALQNANIGDTIKVKTSKNKIFNAIIKEKNLAIIR